MVIRNSPPFQETSFASNLPVTRSLSSVSAGNKNSSSKIPVADTNNKLRTTTGQRNSINAKIGNKKVELDSLEQISPWLVDDADKSGKGGSKASSRIPQLKTVITTEL